MEEKIIVKSEQYNIKIVLFVIWIVGVLSSIIAFFLDVEYSRSIMVNFRPLDPNYASISSYLKWYTSIYGHGISDFFGVPAIVLTVFFVIGILVYWWLSKTEMIATDKRVYGKTVFGKRVDLPLDSISAVGSKWPKGVAVATSSGRISFLMIKNRDEIHKCVNNLLIERQIKPTATTTIKQEVPKSDADELKKYKELLDSGILTQEEFDAKKKQLLGL